MPDITRPDHFLQLARTLDRVFDDLPQAEHLRRGDDISPAIHSVVSDIGYILTEISEELTTSNRHDYEGWGHGPAERFGTAALTQCAPPLGTALAHLGRIVDRLGFLHENVRHSSTARTPTPGDVRLVLQEHLDHVGTALRTAAQQLRGTATQLSRTTSSHARATSARNTHAQPPSPIPAPASSPGPR
ncbi:hypothetical protein SLA_7153 [Streptomyces laurentii]|uniref:Uncharacterized protein n=1 Tax=Streptomyces laurentii TaxID=39478 RepID=A0A160P7S6_STRLU|nr:hypothetical protein SLA_7153 [Streptomyces laurentii]